jgi:hypothetical protein
MNRLRPSTTGSPENESHELALGRQSLVALIGLNGLVAAMLLSGLSTSFRWLAEVALWLFGLQVLLIALVFMPIVLYRLLWKKERLILAASRAIRTLVETISLSSP